MSIRENILQRLVASKNGAVERIVEGAMAGATPQEAGDLGQVLLQRNRRGGLVALIRHFDHLPAELQGQMTRNPRELFGPLADTMDDGVGNGRANVIEIIRHAADPKLVFLLTQALSDGRAEVRQLAASSLLEAVRKHRSPAVLEGDTQTVADREKVRSSLEFALRQFRAHRQINTVLAALAFERQQSSPLWAFFADPHEELGRAAATILRQLPDPVLATSGLLALASPLRSAAVAGLSFCQDEGMAQAVARQSFRLLDPLVRAGAAAVAHPRMLAGEVTEEPWTAETWLDWFRLVENLGLPAQVKLAWYRRLGETAGNRGEKMLVVRAIAGLGTAEAWAALPALAGDEDEVVARSAARYLLARRQGDWRGQAGNMLQSPHDSVRRLVAQVMSPGQFERLWQQYVKLPPAVQVSSTRALAEHDGQFSELLRSKLGSANSTETAQGLRMLQALPSPVAYREQIISLCGHSDPRIAASAVHLVGRLEDPKLRDLLEAAARHYDARVRANAVEAMEQLHVAHLSQQVLGMLNSRFNRERANAIKAFSQFDFRTARECLRKMLADPSPHHRLSALWVVEQLDLLDILRQVGAMARRDPHTRVRKYAQEQLDMFNEISTTVPPLAPD